MSEKTAKILLAAVILARSSSYVLAKIGLTDIDVFNLMGIRFLMAFFIMLLFFLQALAACGQTQYHFRNDFRCCIFYSDVF